MNADRLEPRTAQQLTRHADMALPRGVYTDPRLVNTADAVEALPDLANSL